MGTFDFLKSVSNDNETRLFESDRILGTTKVRTYCANANVFSEESDLDKLAGPVRYRKEKEVGNN